MHCLFNHFGSKWQMARHYDKPSNLVIEPFAGGANFSLYHNCPNVRLYDLDEDVVSMWDHLINSSERDIERLPDYIDDINLLQELTRPEALLISRWLYASPVRGVVTNSNLGFYKRKIASGFKWLWSPYVKQRILRQKPLIANWSIEHCSYENIPNVEAYWFIDPPYQYLQTSKYKHGRESIDFTHLSDWCKSRKGSVTVCEKEGADWLPFQVLREHTCQHGSKYNEVVWTNRNAESPKTLGELI